jgi:ATP-dependent DNA helicase RecQ
MIMTRKEAERSLQKIFGIQSFYDDQWTAINEILNGGRVLLIHRTGFGKSLCYQFPATQFSGLTVIFSPLIALMRDQVNNLNKLGINAKYINSEQSYEENSQTIREAIEGKLKILYIAPERQENQEWIEATRQMNLSMVVIDEAHTVSVWGHDFRPAFRRIINLVNLLPVNLPVLATTATATKRVQKDIETQIGGKVKTIRGNLLRDNFRLFVIETKSEDEKMLWLAENLNNIPGSGLIYSGTRFSTDIYSRWFEYINISSVNYNAGLDADSRKEIEQGLMENRWKCVVSTNALGMGIDKKDIRFIIHTQIPASPIHYYQEIGRAGRDGKTTYIILFYNSNENEDGVAEDYKLPLSFIEGGKPSIDKYYRVIEALKKSMLTESEILKETNLIRNQIRVIKADLIDQGIIKEVMYGKRKNYEYQFNAPELNTKKFDVQRELKMKDLDAMVDYVNTKEPRMKYLCSFLDDDSSAEYSNCDNTKYTKRTVTPQKETAQKLKEFKDNFFPVLNVQTSRNSMVDGVASGYYGFPNIGSTIHRCKYENGGDFPDFLLTSVLRAYRKRLSDYDYDLILYVPSTVSKDLVKNFAEKLSSILKIPISHKLIKTRKTKQQKQFQNFVLKKDNIAGAFDYTAPNEIKGKNILLIDDIFDSGNTIKEIGKMLSKYGADIIAPLVIAKTVGGDI